MRHQISNLLTAAAVAGACAFGVGGMAVKAAAPATPQGYVNFRTFPGDQRAAVLAGTAVPDGSFYPKRFEGPYNGYPGPDPGDDDTAPLADNRDSYTTQVVGYFYPPKDGNVQFAIATDDPGVLYFSTDEDPAHKTQIATESQWNPVRAFASGWDTSTDPPTVTRRAVITTGDPPIPRPENWSAYIAVKKGVPYFIESIHAEFGGGDNNAVAFHYQGDPDFADGDKPILGANLAPFYPVPTAAVILAQPTDVAVYAGGIASFSVAVDIGPTGTITSTKWQKNNVDVPNSNALKISFPAAVADDAAKIKAIVTTSLGTLTSADAILNVATIANEFVPAVAKWEVYNEGGAGIAGNSVDSLTSDANFPDKPDDIRILDRFESPVNQDQYGTFGARMSGFFVPPADGNYVFFMTSDDNGALFLSTDDNPANKKQIAAETTWSNAREWTISGGSSDLDSKRSDKFPTTEWPGGNTITLKGGKHYYLEILAKEGGGGDDDGATVIKEGDPDPATGSPSTLTGTAIGANAKPNKGDPQITKQPVTPAQLNEGRSYTFSVDGIVTPAGYNFQPIIQWQKDGANITGATGNTFTIAKAAAADAGTYRAVVSAPSGKSVNSVDVVATFVPDKTPPTVTAALRGATVNTKVVVIFSEPVSDTSANTVANYKINNGITVSAAKLSSNPLLVELTTTAIADGTKNQLTVSGVQDLFGNTITANSTIDIGVQKKIFFATADAGPLTFPGDIAVNQHLLDRGFEVELALGNDVPADGSTALGSDLIIESSSLGSGTVEDADTHVGKFKNLAIPAMEWEASSIDAFGFAELNSVLGTIASQTQINIVDASSPLAAGFPTGPVTVSAPATYSVSIPVGGHIVARPGPGGDQTYALIYYYEKGEKGFNDFVMPARREFFFFQDNTADVVNDNGWKLFDASVDWLLGVAAPVTPPGGKFTGIKIQGGNIVIDFTGSGVQSADTVLGPWTDESGSSPLTVPVASGPKFYRFKP